MKEPLTIVASIEDKGAFKDNSKIIRVVSSLELSPAQAARLHELFLEKEVGVSFFEIEDKKDLKH